MAIEGLARSRLLVAILLVLLTCPARSADPPAARPLRLMLLWRSQSQFAGYYLAKDKGIYSRRGLEVEILRGGPDRNPLEALQKGEVDISVLWLATALSAADRGVPITHLAQVFGGSNLEIVAWKEKGLNRLQDLDGRRVSLWGEPFRPAFTALFKSQGVSPVVVPQHYTVNLFLRRGVDACSVMHYNEYHMLFQAGVDESELARFPLKDHVEFPEDGLYCLRSTREARPDDCRAFVEATMEGWKYAADHPKEALDSVMVRVDAAKLPTNRTHMQWMLKTVLESVFPSSKEGWTPGVLSRESYAAAVRSLKDLGVIKGAPAYEEFVR
jgi:NitT/TauT family transport system substrate-binding protein